MKFSAMYPKTGEKSEQFISNLLKHAQAKSSSQLPRNAANCSVSHLSCN
jgi:hypothetical protein